MGVLKRAAPARRATVITACMAAFAMLSGCRVDKHEEGGSENVKIATPFGGMSVKTNDDVVQQNVGLSVYPGATLVKKDHTDKDGHDHDSGAADIHLDFGRFHLGVKALSYTTQDAPEKVQAFYRKDLSRYGAVILCAGHHAVGVPTETQDGLTCSDDKHTHVQGVEEDSDLQLKAGSRLHQHIVGIDPMGSGTKIGLVALDLPGNLGLDDDEKQ